MIQNSGGKKSMGGSSDLFQSHGNIKGAFYQQNGKSTEQSLNNLRGQYTSLLKRVSGKSDERTEVFRQVFDIRKS